MKNIQFRRIDFKLSLLFALTSVIVVLILQLGAEGISLWQAPSNEKISENLEAELDSRKDEIKLAFAREASGKASRAQASPFSALAEAIYGGEMELNYVFEEDFSYDPYISTIQMLAFYNSKGELLEEILCPLCQMINLEELPELPERLELSEFTSEIIDSSKLIATPLLLSQSHTSIITDERFETIWLHYPLTDENTGRIVGHLLLQVYVPGLQTLTLPMLFDTHFRDLFEILLFSLLIGALIGSIVSRGIVKRILHISDITKAWAQGNLTLRITDNKQDELNGMANDMNTMAEDLGHWLSERESMVMQEERTRVARDLHDTVKQKMFALQMQLSSAKQVTQQGSVQHGSKQYETAQLYIDQALQLVRDSQDDLKSIIYALRPISLEQKGLIQTMRDYLQQWQARTSIIVEIQLDESKKLPIKLEDTLYNIFQELMANIERHAQAEHVVVDLSIQKNDIILTIEDDGIGFDDATVEKEGINKSTGLQSIRDRLDEQHGQLNMTKEPNQGTRMQVIIQLGDQVEGCK